MTRIITILCDPDRSRGMECSIAAAWKLLCLEAKRSRKAESADHPRYTEYEVSYCDQLHNEVRVIWMFMMESQVVAHVLYLGAYDSPSKSLHNNAARAGTEVKGRAASKRRRR